MAEDRTEFDDAEKVRRAGSGEADPAHAPRVRDAAARRAGSTDDDLREWELFAGAFVRRAYARRAAPLSTTPTALATRGQAGRRGARGERST
jgi:hypothetical protein